MATKKRIVFLLCCWVSLGAAAQNAMRWEDSKDFKPGDPPGKGRVVTQKTLMLNFWRPGEEYLESERIIQYGIPGKVDYAWVYR